MKRWRQRRRRKPLPPQCHAVLDAAIVGDGFDAVCWLTVGHEGRHEAPLYYPRTLSWVTDPFPRRFHVIGR